MTIDEMVRMIDSDTESIGADRALTLVGSTESQYLRAIQHRAAKLGLKTAFAKSLSGNRFKYPVAVDVETAPMSVRMMNRADVDNVAHEGISCSAEAAFKIIQEYAERECHVAIIGRGHSVKHLRVWLEREDYTTTVITSKTRNIPRVTETADVVVNSAPVSVSASVCGKLIVDISGTLKEHTQRQTYLAVARGDVPPKYIGANEVGRLNTALLLNRFVRR